jgi:AcrR family transcriptional regulator
MTSTPDENERPYAGTSASQRKAERLERLLEAALTVIGEQGFRSATVRAVCGAAELTQRYYYEAFDDAEDMLRQVYERLLERVERTLVESLVENASPDEQIKAGVRALFQLFQNDPHLARVVLIEVLGVSETMDATYRAGFARFATWVDRVGLPTIRIDSGDRDLGVVLTAAVGAVTTVATHWVLDGYDRPLDVVVDNVSFTLQAIAFAVLDGSGDE